MYRVFKITYICMLGWGQVVSTLIFPSNYHRNFALRNKKKQL